MKQEKIRRKHQKKDQKTKRNHAKRTKKSESGTPPKKGGGCQKNKQK